MKKLFNLLLATFTFVNLFSQNPVKILAPNYYNPMQSPPLSPLPHPNFLGAYDEEPALGAQNIQMDGSGQNILFFIVDSKVYDRNGELLGLFYVNDSYDNCIGEVLVVPAGTCKNEFFVFGTKQVIKNSMIKITAFCDKITVAYDENGQLVESQSGLLSMGSNPLPELDQLVPNFTASINGLHERPLYAATKMRPDGSRFVYVNNGDKVFRLKIQNGTLTYDNYVLDLSTVGSFTNQNLNLVIRQEMELITLPNGNLRMAIPIEPVNSNPNQKFIGYATLDFEGNSGNYITGSNKKLYYYYQNTSTEVVRIKGAEFSADGRFLFLSHNKVQLFGNSSIDVFDLNAAIPFNSRTIVSTSDDYIHSQMEIDNQGRILVPSQNHLASIQITPSGSNFTFPISNVLALTNYNATCPFTSDCSDKDLVRLMQDQIDDENYGNYGNIISGVISHNVTGSVIWTPGNASNLTTGNTIYIEDNITVKAGATLEINNMTLKFSPNARLIIENSTNQLNGGRVVLTNGSKLTYNDQCAGQMWRGVEVHGVPSQPQGDIGNTKQASILISRNSTIEHAIVGITAGKYFKNTSIPNLPVFTLVSNTGGGIIETSSATFFNNIRDILFTPYFPSTGAINKSKFSNTTFQTTGALNLAGVHPMYHVELRRVNGIKFEKCDFINTTPDVYDLHKRGVGIFSSGSSFNVKKRCLSPIPSPINCSNFEINTFTNLHIGIYNSGVLTGYPSTSESAQFTNNNLGIYDISGRNNRYINNQFTVAKIAPSNPSGITQTAGIYMRAATGYKVEGNVFNTNTTQGLSLTNSNPFGVVVNNSGIVANEIYRNSFNDLRIGGQSEKVNGSLNQFKSVGLQWKCNTFKNTLKHDLTVLGGRVSFYQGFSAQTPGDSYSSMLGKAANNQFSLAGEDPQNTTLRHDILCQSMDQEFRYTHLQAPLHIPDSYTPNVLLNKGVIPVQQLFNDQTVKPEGNFCPNKIIKLIPGNIVIALPKLRDLADLKKELDLLTGNESNYEFLADSYSYQFHELQTELNEMISIFSQDSVPDRLDSLIEFMNANINHSFIASQLIEMYLFQGKLNLIPSLLSTANLSSDEKAFYTLLLSIASETNNFSDELTALHLENLTILSQNISDGQIIERILGIIESNQQEILYSFLEVSDERSQLISENEQALSAVSSQFKVYPNPSVGSFRILNTSEEKEEYVLTIKNILGQTVWTGEMNRKEKFINIESKDAGIYIVEISKKSGEITETIKIVKN